MHCNNNEVYNVSDSLQNFEHIIINNNYVQFNTTGFHIDAPNNINISLEFLNHSNTGVDGEVLRFDANTSSGTVWFNISGFKKFIFNYSIYRNSTLIDNQTANATGFLSFNESGWSNYTFRVDLNDVYPTNIYESNKLAFALSIGSLFVLCFGLLFVLMCKRRKIKKNKETKI